MSWLTIVQHIQKSARYTIGARIENKLLDLLELVYIAYFSKKDGKIDKISDCIFVLDILKFIITTAWEAKIISDKHFEQIALKLEELGKILGGWKNKLINIDKINPAI